MILEEGGACAPAEIKTGIEVPDFRSELSTGLHQCQKGARGVLRGMGGPRNLLLPVTYDQDPAV